MGWLSAIGTIEIRRRSFSQSFGKVSDNSTDSGYASGGEAERANSPESQKVEELQIDYEELTGSRFYTLGNLEWQLGIGGCAKTSDYIVAVSLYNTTPPSGPSMKVSKHGDHIKGDLPLYI